MKSFDDMLDFTLSPNIKMEVQKSDPQLFDPSPVRTCVSTTSLCFSSPLFSTNNPICFAGENDGFRPLCVMPVKSDGSLCLMDSMEICQPEAMEPNSSPKLENFLGSGTMGDQQFGAEDREQVHSLESMLCNQNVGGEETNRQLYLDFLQEPTREGEIQVHQHPYCSGLLYHNTCLASLDAEVNEFNYLRNWILGYHSLNQQINCPMVDSGSVSGPSGAMGSESLQSLSLSMSPGSQSSCVTASQQITPYDPECLAIETKKKSSGKVAKKQTVHRKSISTFGQRTSHYRGVTRHRWTGRYEAHLWDNSCKKEGQTRKGRQVYLGGYDKEEKAARSYDLAALKYWGHSTHTNFPLENYQQELEEMKNMSRQEYVAHLRRRSSGFSRGASAYRGVTRHHQHGRWQARIGRVAGNKDLYLGTFGTQEEAAEAYDIAAIKFRGATAVTNFDISCYNVEQIMASNTLPTGQCARRTNAREPCIELENHHPTAVQKIDASIDMDNAAIPNLSDWKMSLYQLPDQQQQNVGDSAVLVSSDSARLVHASTGDESAKVGAYFSHSSSLVTSLSSSREASPDKHSESMRFAEPPSVVDKFISPTTNVNSWIPSAPIAAVPISVAYVPAFAAWSDT